MRKGELCRLQFHLDHRCTKLSPYSTRIVQNILYSQSAHVRSALNKYFPHRIDFRNVSTLCVCEPILSITQEVDTLPELYSSILGFADWALMEYFHSYGIVEPGLIARIYALYVGSDLLWNRLNDVDPSEICLITSCQVGWARPRRVFH